MPYFVAAVGFGILFIGAFIAGVAGAVLASCVGSSCSAGWGGARRTTMASGIVVAMVGLLFVGGGAGLRLWPRAPTGAGPSGSYREFFSERWISVGLVIVAMVLLVWLIAVVSGF